ncbi:MAG: apolipoprotein N-acyltransferase [Tetrasphaera jenkinsii]|uniref:Apolipoprotein N-acyltransferase n=1 Tax=Nostocoides jenkinsii Ben 74 TaxID=1193518 RepID=A0A077ME29_9MICO|nr:apolipoprotein N-acyltransferase [Tetrasphaera jenkinsii]MCI1262038.1 apolipoprotein N-acyltransferase [Tetrasphaera jenkinsii]CCI53113.1 putative polyprenol phosphate mannosyl transferase 2 [Tetrasphaera jenkinsii Ben 74]
MRLDPTAGPILPARLLLALAGGGAIALAFPGTNWWYSAWLGCALVAAAGWCARWRTGLLTGLVGGLAYFIPSLSWSGVYVGKVPWFALATLEALYVAVMVAVVGPLQRRLVAARWGWAAYGIVPLGWVVGEWARSTTPFGGFPWVRLAFSQADSPLRTLASLGGAPLVTAGVATVGVLLYAAAVALRRRPGAAVLGIVATLAAAYLVGGLKVGLGGDAAPRMAEIALVQGNVPKPGLDFNAERRAVLDNHVRETQKLATYLSRADLIVWPENSSDIDPLRNLDAAAAINRARAAIPATFLIGAILEEPAPFVSNASLLYRPGEVDPERYIKQHPVPFAEYVPAKSFFRHFNSNVDLVRDGMAKGTQTGYFELSTDYSSPGQPYTFAALPTICFEVAYDGLVRTSVTHRPDVPSVLIVQTNNATFGYTAESEQQFAISRLRAIEHNRSVVHVSTVGVSGFINADGTYANKSSLFTAYTASSNVELRSGITVADRIGRAPEYVSLGGLLLAWAGGAWAGRRRSRRDNDEHPTPTSKSKETASA